MYTFEATVATGGTYKEELVSEARSEGIWLSGKTLDCRPRDCKFDPPSLQLNY